MSAKTERCEHSISSFPVQYRRPLRIALLRRRDEASHGRRRAHSLAADLDALETDATHTRETPSQRRLRADADAYRFRGLNDGHDAFVEEAVRDKPHFVACSFAHPGIFASDVRKDWLPAQTYPVSNATRRASSRSRSA